MSVKIAIVGTGYVGLVTGACFAEVGHEVICVDNDARKIRLLAEGRIPIYEPGLDELVRRNMESGRLSASTDIKASVKDCDAVFIAVGTPTEAGTDRADLRYVHAAAAEIARAVTGFTVVVTKSTVPVGTNNQVFEICQQHISPGAEIAVASNPEFLREGAAIKDFLEPDRVVIGVSSPRARDVMGRIYAPLLLHNNVPLVTTTIETAELLKYAANAFLAVKISFIDEMANLCEAVGANVEDVARGIGLDKRIGPAFLNTGPGWGGSCFPKDTRALLATANDAGVDCLIVDSAVRANASRKVDMVDRIVQAVGGSVSGRKITVLGVTFKGQTDDMRESTSLVVIPALQERGAEVTVFDPSFAGKQMAELPGVRLAETAFDGARDADALVILADWMVFKTYDLKKLADVMASKTLVDLRNLFTREDAAKGGFSTYVSLGRKAGD
jgi:UDPglucose 6-dehydrogenase